MLLFLIKCTTRTPAAKSDLLASPPADWSLPLVSADQGTRLDSGRRPLLRPRHGLAFLSASAGVSRALGAWEVAHLSSSGSYRVPSLHDNTRQWRLTRPSALRDLLSLLSLTADAVAFNSKRKSRGDISVYFLKDKSPRLECLMTVLCRKCQFQSNSQHNRTELSLRGGPVDTGFYDIVNLTELQVIF